MHKLSDKNEDLLVINPNTSPAVTALIDEQVQLAVPSGTTARTCRVGWGTPSIETHIDAAVAAVALLDTLAAGVGARGVLVGAFGDPGLLAARELLDIPVLGIGESALAEAAERGDFAILTIQPASVPLVRELVRNNNYEDACVTIEALPVSVLEAASPAAIRGRLLSVGRELGRDPRVKSIVLGGAPLGVHAEYLSDQVGVEFIDPVTAGVKRLAGLAAAGSARHRADSYDQLKRKEFEGNLEFLKHLNQTLWR
ncbi:MAG: aspartate/glutamate racemase family protein [Arthrobacter sp.]|nr:aspartate/glutamate racemase family protein [Arthrobacter sp.]